MNQVLDLLLVKLHSIFGILVLSLIIIEWVILVLARKMESNKEGWVNLLCYVFESIPYVLLGKIVIFGTMTLMYEYRFFTLGFAWYIWILAYLTYDFVFWLVHLLGHKVRFFWCIHGVHHTAEEMKLTVTVRGSFLGFLHMPHTVIWLPVLGFDPVMIFIVESFARLYSLYEHVNDNFDKLVGKQRFLEKLFITPTIHRVHHAKNLIYLDTNYGETFSIWDRIFGTFQTELDDVKPMYGIINERINSKNFLQVQLQLWKDLWNDMSTAPRLIDKLKYIIMPPGWNHINGGKMAGSYRSEGWKEYSQQQMTQQAHYEKPAQVHS
jgi:sterol desaturase/sphingolipid hydroxylase (fatty acid hydroxylase superfamily)